MMQTASDQQWYQKITSYLGDLTSTSTIANRQGMSWTWWSWNPNSGDTGGILQDDWVTVQQVKVDKLTPIEFAWAQGGGTATARPLSRTAWLSARASPTAFPSRSLLKKA